MNVFAKLVSLGAVAASGFVATKIADKSWTRITGNEPPKDQDGQDALVQVLAFTVLSAGIAALVQHFVLRSTNNLLTKAKEAGEEAQQS